MFYNNITNSRLLYIYYAFRERCQLYGIALTQGDCRFLYKILDSMQATLAYLLYIDHTAIFIIDAREEKNV